MLCKYLLTFFKKKSPTKFTKLWWFGSTDRSLILLHFHYLMDLDQISLSFKDAFHNLL